MWTNIKINNIPILKSEAYIAYIYIEPFYATDVLSENAGKLVGR